MNINSRQSLFAQTTTSPLAYAEKLAGKEKEEFKINLVSEKELAERRKLEEKVEIQRRHKGQEGSDFFIRYAEIRESDAPASVTETAKALDTNTDEHILAGADSAKSIIENKPVTDTPAAQADVDIEALFEQMTAQSAVTRENVKTSTRLEEMADKFFERSNEINGVDTTRKLNEDSAGDKELTAEQINELKEKYNVKCMTPQERYDLFCDLTDMGVLTSNDVKMLGVGKFMNTDGTLVESRNSSSMSFDPSNLYEYIMTLVSKEQRDYDFMSQLDNQDDLDANSQKSYNKFKNEIGEIDSLIASHQKVANVLAQLG